MTTRHRADPTPPPPWVPIYRAIGALTAIDTGLTLYLALS